jgi:hypothetical protein
VVIAIIVAAIVDTCVTVILISWFVVCPPGLATRVMGSVVVFVDSPCRSAVQHQRPPANKVKDVTNLQLNL